MRVLIIGASGFIGHSLIRRLQQESDYVVSNTYNSRSPQHADDTWYPLDVTDHPRLSEVYLQVRPDVVVLLAAIADVGTAEREPERATAVKVDGAAQVAWLCAQHQARLVFLSSEYVFGGTRGNYREDDAPDPNTHYGRNKLEAELAIARAASAWSVIRTSFVYGWPLIGRQNVATGIIDRLKRGDRFDGHTDTYRTPIYVEHLTTGIMRLVADYHPGIYHIAGEDWLSMYQFARLVAEVFDLESSLVTPVQGLVNSPSKANLIPS
jgi:dTDP-4-dehydrorhamnose reductase